jgi:2-hydroxy-3-oxopropionate reductase
MGKTRVGFIGVGEMGKPMVKNVLKAGFDTIVYDLQQDQAKELQKLGASVSKSAKELATVSDVVITMVRDDPQTEEVIYGKEGVLEGMDMGIIIAMSTISPGLVQKLAKKVESRIGVLDSPVSGGLQGAHDGTLTLMVGGKKEVLEKCRLVLDAMSSRIIYCGQIGAGLVAKLTNSMIVHLFIGGILESLALGNKAGVDESILFDIYKTSTAGSWLAEHWDWVTYIRKNPSTWKLLHKDISLSLNFAKEIEASIPLASFCSTLDFSLKE